MLALHKHYPCVQAPIQVAKLTPVLHTSVTWENRPVFDTYMCSRCINRLTARDLLLFRENPLRLNEITPA